MDDTRSIGSRDARTVFAGLTPRLPEHEESRNRARLRSSMHATMPLALVGSMAVTMGLTGPVEPAHAEKRPDGLRPSAAEQGKTVRQAMAAAREALKTTADAVRTAISPPTLYTVVAGDSVSEISARYGLSTASVLALNGLGWSTLIFPGQVIKLTASGPVPAPPQAEALHPGRYTIVAGDTISQIAERFGVSTVSVLTANGLSWSSIIYPGQSIVIPGQSLDTAPDAPAAEQPEAPAQEQPSGPEVAPEQETEAEAEPLPEVATEPEPEQAPEPPPAPEASGSTYLVAAGDTLSGIAARFGLSTQALLDANGLSWSSIIYPGNRLTVPTGAAPAAVAGSVTPLSAEMRENAAVIVQVGRELGVPDFGIVIALATAMQESSLRNLNWGDRDSVGLFQQRPSAGWGTVEELTTPSHAARLFYGGPSNPNRGWTRGLLDIAGWQSMPLTRAAQAVQISAFPDHYAKWEASAWAWFAELG